MIRAAMLAVSFVVLVAGCRSGDAASTDITASTTTTAAVVETSTTTTSPPDYTGDPGSAFCAVVVEGDDRPLLDPFGAGLESGEVELRVRALVVRFDRLAVEVPPELADDIDALASALVDLDDTLAEYDYDLGAAGGAGADLSFLDDPAFADIAARLAAYRAQVCASP